MGRLLVLVGWALGVFAVLVVAVLVVLELRGPSTPSVARSEAPAPRPAPPPHDAERAWYAAREFVGRRLRAPADAKFGPGPKAAEHRGNGFYAVSGIVDAPNPLGVRMRHYFWLEVRLEGQEWLTGGVLLAESIEELAMMRQLHEAATAAEAAEEPIATAPPPSAPPPRASPAPPRPQPSRIDPAELRVKPPVD